MKNSFKHWTDEQVAILRTLARGALTAAEIGERLGRSSASVIAKLDSLGVPRRRVDQGQRGPARKSNAEKAELGAIGGRKSAELRREIVEAEQRRPWNPATDPRPECIRRRG